jgi:hypothetical protein
VKPETSRYLIIVLFALAVVASGCTDTSTTNPDVNGTSPTEDVESNQGNGDNSDNDESLLGGNSVETYTTGDENLSMTVETDNNSETYDLIIEQKDVIEGNEYFSEYDAVNLSASIMCGLVQQIAYNYTALSDRGETSGLGGDNQLSEGLGGSDSSEETELPQWAFEDFEAEKVEYTLKDRKNSEVASCQPTEDNLNIELNIEPNSENAEELS